MPKLKMKIKDYDEVSNSVIASFCTDESLKSIDEYPSYCYQPRSFHETDPNKFLSQIARAGWHVAQQQDEDDRFFDNPDNKKIFQSWIGKEFEFTEQDIATAVGQTISISSHTGAIHEITDDFLTEITI